MESNARFLNIKSSRFKEDYKGTESLGETPSVRLSSRLPLSPEGITLQVSSKQQQQSKIQIIARFLHQQRGAHHPVSYQDSFGFSEKWETASKETASSQAGFMHLTGELRWASFALFPFLVVQLWFVSVFRVFSYDNNEWMFAVGLALQLLCLAHKVAVLAGELQVRGDICHQLGSVFSRERMFSMAGNVYSVFYYAVASGTTLLSSSGHLWLFLLDLVLILYKYLVLEDIYSMIRIEVIGSRYKLFMNLFDLASNVFLMIHVFAVLLYLCTYASPESNWHTLSPISSPDDWIGDYVEAFYFACTTMLTVGFGDIRPTNLLEVGCILMVQLVGIMNNAYVINEIGANLSLIHDRRNTLEKDIANAQKLINFNRMPNQTRTRMLDYLVRNQLANEELSIPEEDALLDKLSEEFKGEIKESSQLRIIHKNLFMLANFSRRFQHEISKKLVKAIYPPHAVLPNHAGRERLYIIAKGAVDFITEKRYIGRVLAEKVIKSIEVKEDASNHYMSVTYGYASLFSGKRPRIKAVAKNFAVCFYLEHQDVLECMVKSSEDFERYFEIKHKVELLEMPQKYQFPSLTSNRQHYCPNVYFLIKKERKDKYACTRKYLLRSKRRLAKVFENFQEDTTINSASANGSTDSFPSGNIIEQPHRKQTILSNFSPVLMDNINSPFVSKPRNVQHRELASKQYLEMRRLKLQEKVNAELKLDSFCENFKEYKNYYPKANLSYVIEKSNERKNFKKEMECENLSSSRLTLLKNKRRKLASSSNSQ